MRALKANEHTQTHKYMYSHCSPGSVRAWGSGSWAGRLGLGLDTLDRMLGHARCTHRILQTHPLSDLSFPSILLDLQNTVLISMKIKHWLILTFAETVRTEALMDALKLYDILSLKILLVDDIILNLQFFFAILIWNLLFEKKKKNRKSVTLHQNLKAKPRLMYR